MVSALLRNTLYQDYSGLFSSHPYLASELKSMSHDWLVQYHQQE
jgi:hypothetical protein